MAGIQYGNYGKIQIPKKKINQYFDENALTNYERQYRDVNKLHGTTNRDNATAAQSDDKRYQRGAALAQADRINALRSKMKLDPFDVHSHEDPYFKPNMWGYTNINTSPFVDPSNPMYKQLMKNPENLRVMMSLGHQEQEALRGLDATNSIPELIRGNYTEAAKRAGTFSNTEQFKTGLDDEVNYGVEGANLMQQQRADTLNKQDAGYNALRTTDPLFNKRETRKERRAAALAFKKANLHPTNEPSAPPPLAAPELNRPTGGKTPTPTPTPASSQVAPVESAAPQPARPQDTTTPSAGANSSPVKEVAANEPMAQPQADETAPEDTLVSGAQKLGRKGRMGALAAKRGI